MICIQFKEPGITITLYIYVYPNAATHNIWHSILLEKIKIKRETHWNICFAFLVWIRMIVWKINMIGIVNNKNCYEFMLLHEITSTILEMWPYDNNDTMFEIMKIFYQRKMLHIMRASECLSMKLTHWIIHNTETFNFSMKFQCLSLNCI